MNENPNQKGHEAAGLNSTSLQHRKVLADDCHVPFVGILEGARQRFALEELGNHLTHVPPLLDRNLSDTRPRSVLTRESDITHRENALGTRYHQERINRKPSHSIFWDTERLHNRRSTDACSP